MSVILPTNFDPNQNAFLESDGSRIDIGEVTWDNLDSSQQAMWRRRALDAGVIGNEPDHVNRYRNEQYKLKKFYEENKNQDSTINIADSIPFSVILNILDSLGIKFPPLATQVAQNIPTENQESPSLPQFPDKIKLIKVRGTVVDQTNNEPIKGVTITGPLKNIKRTNKKGEFTIKVPSLINTEGEIHTGLNPTNFPIKTLKVKYAPNSILPYKSTGEVKEDLGILSLSPLESNLQKEINELLTLRDEEVDKYTTRNVTFEFSIQKKLNVSIDDLKKIVIPLILTLIAQYGLTKVQELVEENKDELTEELKTLIVCPPKDALLGIINTKNKLVKKINQTLNSIKTTSQTIEFNDGLITTIDTVYQVLKVLPVPTAVAGVGIPISVVNTVQDVKNFLSNNIGKLKQGSGGLSSILNILVSVLEQVLSFLNLLDKITQFCSSDISEGDNIKQVKISEELTALTQQQAEQLSPIVLEVNGFKMEVETEITERELKRRRAIAINPQGVVMLRGEYSFSSIDQILIDELVFYIQTNDLKAD